jgi:GNAT superfamily N-acetyltransferase
VVDNTAPVEVAPAPPVAETVIRYAENDNDCIAIHQFLLEVAQPAMRCPVSHQKSAAEVWRVATQETAIMAFHKGRLVGTMGLIAPEWWYGDGDRFLTDRWHFVLPEFRHTEIDRLLMDEAKDIAIMAGLEFIHQGKIRAARDGVLYTNPRLMVEAA